MSNVILRAAAVFLLLSLLACGSSLGVVDSGTSSWSGCSVATVTHYTLSDNSLNFVKLVLDGVEYTLPQVVSGDGSRYTREMDIVWWERGDSAFVQSRNQSGEWETTGTFTLE